MTENRTLLEQRFRKRLLNVAIATALAFVAVGYLTGTRPPTVTAASEHPAAPTESERALSYSELAESRRGPNAGMYEGAFDALVPQVDLFAPLEQTPEDRERALAERQERRAYDGAPPTIPHRIDQANLPSCLACHESGAKIGDRIAPIISHEKHASCTQCHVVEVDPRGLGDESLWVENEFEGIRSSGAGSKAWPGAPPVISHSVNMRENCMSCHGPRGLHGLRSSHPWRQSCQQCHAPSAALDQRVASAPPYGEGP